MSKKRVRRGDGWLEHQRIEDSLDDAVEEYNVTVKPKIRRKRRKRRDIPKAKEE